MAKILGQVKSIWPDRTQYKPYAYNLELQRVAVELDIPDEMVIHLQEEEGPEEWTVLTLEGFTFMLGNIADAIDGMHIRALKSKNSRESY